MKGAAIMKTDTAVAPTDMPTEAKTDMSPSRSLEFFPVTLFAVVMGIGGLAIVYDKAYHLLDFSRLPYLLLLFLAAGLFLFNTVVYAMKAARFPQRVKEEFFHPVKMNFFPAISISLLLLSIAFYSYWPVVSIPLWFLGTLLHTALTFYIFSYWIRHNFEIHHSNPAWFIPIVGNVLVPIIGVDIAGSEAMVFFFTIGILFWLVLFAVILYRIIFHHQLAQKFLPTLFILIAPPAVGFISYLRLSMNYDLLALVLLDTGYFITLLLLLMGKNFLRLRFFVSWWAFTFPMAAMTIATLVAYQVSRHAFYLVTGYLLIAITTVIIAAVAYQTLVHAKKGEICIQE